ncbi:hypothetical protein A9Q78_11315 [Methylophaga sp. 41_12_T18]|nr:hypothetical protein A9Q78_11315 [Methylophaga sp. 41_12_T18]
MTTELEPEVLVALDKGRKIEAIKLLREQRSIGLKEAKQIIDEYSAAHPSPNASVERNNSTSGLIKLVILAAVVYFLYVEFIQ